MGSYDRIGAETKRVVGIVAAVAGGLNQVGPGRLVVPMVPVRGLDPAVARRFAASETVPRSSRTVSQESPNWKNPRSRFMMVARTLSRRSGESLPAAICSSVN